jgi:phage terminase large subunit-like protein
MSPAAKKTRSPDSGEAFGLPPAATLKRLKISREVAWFLVSRGIPFPEFPPFIKTPEPRTVKGAAFDPERVDHVLSAFKNLRHTQGTLAGQPLIPDPWQVAYIIAPVFGWVRRNDAGRWVRIIRNFYLDVPRKNGKTTLCGGFAIYLTAADGENGAQVLAAASTKDQARFVFDPIKHLAERAPALRGHVKALNARIIHPRTNSYFGVVSSAADAQHGANIHGAIIDELHIHKKPDTVEAIETGTGSREQPLVIKITTADDGKPNTIYARNRHYVEQLARGIFKDETSYGVVFAVERDADPFAERTWKQSNPGYPVSPTRDFMIAEANKARNNPALLAAFKRLHLGIRTKQTTQFIDVREWKLNAGQTVRESDLEGRIAYGGLDLASVSDLTALCWLFPFDDGPGYDAIWRFWTPEDNLDALDKRTAGAASKLWVPQGWLLTTPGNVTDYEFIKAQILSDADSFDVQSVGFDRWNSSHLVNELMDEGIPVVKVGQGYLSMSPALKEVQRLVKMGAGGAAADRRPRLRHGGNPVALWNVDNLAVDMDPAGNVKPSKATSADKIDGVSALCDAMSEALAAPEIKKSAYELHGVRAV